MAQPQKLMEITELKVGCWEASVKTLLIRVGLIGCSLALFSVADLLIRGEWASLGGNTVYAIFCLLLIYAACSDNLMLLWPFIIYNAILILMNIIAAMFFMGIYMIAKFTPDDRHEKTGDEKVEPIFLLIIVIFLFICAFLNVFFEYVVVKCYRTLRHAMDPVAYP
ncbi:unnamed protein product [Bursaphelenchus xylophilus]|uniref:(pine wood nematode) hypothetical protein n=1 Tax=Bursaphelenchus xylophilus TaxID=6326 RepID=A0A1I7RIB4_BURXY|nr:unnamed protein product [Bursaphelenchus xylophilus]CAG9115022.1 unnamed protein product [Bursaphelenchus xylophilus]